MRSKSRSPAAPPPAHPLTQAEISLFERLIDRGALVTVPAVKSQKPRKVIAAALAEHGTKVLLYLSAKPMEAGEARQPLTDAARPADSRSYSMTGTASSLFQPATGS